MKIIYVACPYSSFIELIRNERFEAANKHAATLMMQGHVVFSPISHSHPISKHLGNSNDSDFYVNQDLYWLKFCDEVHVLQLAGWEQSSGIQKELKEARKLGINVKYIVNERR